MKITGLHVEQFGALRETSVEGFGDGLNVVIGPNGSGKTTLLQFTRAVLYGFPPVDSTRFLPALHPGRQGGTVRLTNQGVEFSVSRYSWGRSSGQIDVRCADGTTDSISGLLDRVSDSTFNTLFTVGFREAEQIDELVQDTLDDTSDGLTNVPEPERLNAALHRIQAEQTELIGGAGRSGRRNDLELERQSLEAELTQQQPVENSILNQLAELQSEIEDLDSEVQRVASAAARVDTESAAAKPPRSGGAGHAARAAPSAAGLIADFDRIDARLQTWRQWQRDLNEQISAVEMELGEADWPAGEREDGLRRSRECVERIERELSRLSERLCRDSQCAGIREDGTTALQKSVDSAREHLYGLCRELANHEIADRYMELNDELVHLKRCRRAIGEQLRLLIRRRNRQLRVHGISERETVDQHRHQLAELCRCREHGEWVRSRMQPETSTPDPNTDELNHRTAARRRELEATLTHLKSRSEGLHERRRRLEVELHGDHTSDRTETLRFSLSAVEDELRSIDERSAILAATESMLLAMRDENRECGQSRTLAEASDFLRRLTGSQYTGITVDRAFHTFRVHRTDGADLVVNALSQGVRGQVSLSLRLALANAYARRNVQLPLILDDVFITCDSRHVSKTAELLRETGARGQQILFFTCHRHIADVFDSMGVPVRELGNQTPEAAPAQTPAGTDETPRMDDHVPESDGDASPVVMTYHGSAEEFRGEPDDGVIDSGVEGGPSLVPEARGIYHLELTNSIAELSSVGTQEAEELHTIAVHTIEDLIALVPDAAAIRLSHTDLSAERMRQWQSQALMASRIPMLRCRDAELVVLCGINTPECLARMHPDEVYEAVGRFLRTTNGRRFVREDVPFDRQQAINLVRWSRHARTLWDSRDGVRPAQSSERVSETRAEPFPHRSPKSTESGSSLSESNQDSRAGSGRGQHNSRTVRQSCRRPARSSVHASSAASDSTTPGPSKRRFYLDRVSVVEEAPSIGPKTAERLERVGIITVDDLLNADADETVGRLRHRRIRAKDIRDWQAQASLVCRIPRLRGHDAQILVACDILRPEDLAAMRPNDLFAVVRSFVDTSEGERLIRSGAKPDLKEISDWIEWAGHARRLNAA